MKKIILKVLMGVLVFSSVAQVSAFDWGKYFPSSVEDKIQGFESKFGEGATKKAIIGLTSFAVVLAGYYLYASNAISRLWDRVSGKEEILEEEEKNEEFDSLFLSEKTEEYDGLTKWFTSLNPQDESYEEQLEDLNTETKKLLDNIDQFEYENLYKNVFNLNISILNAKKEFLQSGRQVLQKEKRGFIEKELQDIETYVEDLKKSNFVSGQELSDLKNWIIEVQNKIEENKFDDVKEQTNDLLQEIETIERNQQQNIEIPPNTSIKN